MAISSGKGRTVEAVVEKLGPFFFFFFEGSASDGRSCKDEGEGKKRDQNIQKVESIIGCASQPFFYVRAQPSQEQ